MVEQGQGKETKNAQELIPPPWWLRLFFGAAVRRCRLGSAILTEEEEFKKRLHGQQTEDNCWAEPTRQLLEHAKHALQRNDIDSGWVHVDSVRRMLLYAKDAWELEQVAEVLRQESTKLNNWRRAAVEGLLGDAAGKQQPRPYKEITVDRVFQSALIKDEFYENNYMKIAMRRANLKRLFIILMIIALAFPLLAFFCVMPDPLNRPWTLVALEGFGALGAAFSVATTLTKRPLSAAIPDQMLGSFVTWMRPVIGAVSALAAFVLVQAGWLPEGFDGIENNFPAMLALAFLAGFSERFVVGVLDSKSKKDESK